ncbi:flagellar biosynthesis/type III secretory pathway chaperone [Acetoanaerobium pronyense]|uniref:Flagellar biosynthesis/type III secretory pathway chaperone n=1 Tax=Acetoanaerobium pronyense TaxID=1482736 RepID=A0ABS4KMJ4_9FIRM|nr:flagellar protein FlgN [Acetoanaerobium pronyense]MBP2029009.1 flagellar biosynthesis/type III secretory pathway chaperone [Acetoanaerobium pronyense]
MDIYSKILETLRGQLDANKALLDLSKEKSNILRENNTSKLMLLASEEEKLVRKTIELEKERGNLVNALKVNDQSITDLSSLISKTSPVTAENTKKVSQELKEILTELQLQNDLNNKIMEIALEQIEFSKNVLMGASEPQTYGKIKGNYAGEKQAPGKKFFEDKF